MPRIALISCLLLTLFLQGCLTYEPRATRATPFKLPEAYGNMQRVEGAYVAARAWDREEEAQQAFGFNIIRAGLLPVQVSFDNRGTHTLVIVPSQTLLSNRKQELSPVLSDQEAYDRVSRGTRFQEGVKAVTRGGLLGGATGALIGAAVGVVAGHSAGDYVLRGLATGAGSGALLGGLSSGTESRVPSTITEDLTRYDLKNTPIKPGELAYGLILFPRKAGSP
jgi:hypothetical protein